MTEKVPDIRLGDDGTMDTVLYCADCGQEYRYSFDPVNEDETYDDFVAWAIEDLQAEHNCEADDV